MVKGVITKSEFKNICQRVHWHNQCILGAEIELNRAKLEYVHCLRW